jgi:hypothetical protein
MKKLAAFLFSSFAIGQAFWAQEAPPPQDRPVAPAITAARGGGWAA